jgi:hypothetical protein
MQGKPRAAAPVTADDDLAVDLMETRAGIEPTYGDLQSKSGESPKRPRKPK